MLPAIMSFKAPKPRDLNDEMPGLQQLRVPDFNLRDIMLLNAEVGLEVENLSVHAQNLTAMNVQTPVRIIGGQRHVFDGVNFQRGPTQKPKKRA